MFVDAILDIPIVLPPLVIGLSLLILCKPIQITLPPMSLKMAGIIAWGVVPVAGAVILALIVQSALRAGGVASHTVIWRRRVIYAAAWAASLAGGLWLFWRTHGSEYLRDALIHGGRTGIAYTAGSVIIAQFAVACAFAVRTMKVTFDQISPRSEQVAMTLGCTRNEAFWMVVLPEARRGMLAAGTLAWARALGEFGPILVFAGATRRRTEVLSTSVFLELTIGKLEAAIAVSLLMIIAAVLVLILVRLSGAESSMGRGVA